eukprot:TRINITY_DN3749_c0_g1_i4.p1 TRINITY_DN3749_c0_g1~~TRINITY_DN3749_c0_g1_i4.p1  ORF type:complete len:206 (-),score=29.70 TRINITY_DN3749_c0_g1_i4:144-761(-)
MLLLTRKMKRDSHFQLPSPSQLLVPVPAPTSPTRPLHEAERLERKYETLVQQMAECVVYHYLNKRQHNGSTFEWVSNTRNLVNPRSSNCADDKGYTFWFSDSPRGGPGGHPHAGTRTRPPVAPTANTYYLAVKGHISPEVSQFTLNEDEWEVASTCRDGGLVKYIVVGVLLYPQPARLMYWIENPWSLLKSSPIPFQLPGPTISQ